MNNIDSSVYYKDHYWNDYFFVKCEILQRMTGRSFSYWSKWFKKNPDKSSEDALIFFFKSEYVKKPFKRGLVICCGDGRFDRTFYDLGIVEKLDSFDISKELVDKATSKKENRDINYFVADANTLKLKSDSYDLVINVAALHHIQFLNKFLNQVNNAMRADGLFFHFDYIGDHRNQFSLKHWAMLHKLNSTLLSKYKKEKLYYPHIPTMLVTDPSEAIHSELIETYVDRYFDSEIKNYAGGAIAYMLLHNNPLSTEDAKSQEDVLDTVMKIDLKLSGTSSYPNLFMFQVGKPKKKLKIIEQWQVRENMREERASKFFGTYRLIDLIQVLFNKMKLEKVVFKPIWLVVFYFYLFITKDLNLVE